MKNHACKSIFVLFLVLGACGKVKKVETDQQKAVLNGSASIVFLGMDDKINTLHRSYLTNSDGRLSIHVQDYTWKKTADFSITSFDDQNYFYIEVSVNSEKFKNRTGSVEMACTSDSENCKIKYFQFYKMGVVDQLGNKTHGKEYVSLDRGEGRIAKECKVSIELPADAEWRRHKDGMYNDGTPVDNKEYEADVFSVDSYNAENSPTSVQVICTDGAKNILKGLFKIGRQ